MFIAALFTIAKIWKQPKCPPAAECIQKTGYECTGMCVCNGMLLLSPFSRVWPLATPWTAAYQAPPSMGFSRQEYWSGVPLASLWILTNPPLIALSLNEFLQWDIRAWVLLVLAKLESQERAEGQEEKAVGKMCHKVVPANTFTVGSISQEEET